MSLTVSEAVKEASFGVQAQYTQKWLTQITDEYRQSVQSIRDVVAGDGGLTESQVTKHAMLKERAEAAESVLNVLYHGDTAEHVKRRVYDVYLGYLLDEVNPMTVETAVAYEAHMRLRVS